MDLSSISLGLARKRLLKIAIVGGEKEFVAGEKIYNTSLVRSRGRPPSNLAYSKKKQISWHTHLLHLNLYVGTNIHQRNYLKSIVKK